MCAANNFFQGLCLGAEVPFMLEPMVLSVLYVWCNLNRDTIVSFWFGTQFKVCCFLMNDSLVFAFIICLDYVM